jgi:putative transposase
MGQRYHVLATGFGAVGLPVRFPGCLLPPGGGLAGASNHARRTSDQCPTPGLLVHSDRGGQYCSNAYRQLLYDYHAVRSQSRRGECLDNAQAESLWSRLKTEELEQRDWPVFRDLADAQQSVATYFDYYNYERRHSALAYQTPQTFYVQQLKNTALNCLA